MIQKESDIVAALLDGNENELFLLKLREKYLTRATISDNKMKGVYGKELAITQHNIGETEKFITFLKSYLTETKDD